MPELTNIENQIANSISILEILKEACEYNLENAFASHTFGVVEALIEKQSQILDSLSALSSSKEI